MAKDLSKVTDDKKSDIRKSVNLLPILFRTDKNSKFLAGTLDQLIQPPQLKRVDGWVGSRITPTYNPETDFYLTSNLKYRQDYQLEPALVITNEVLKIIKASSYDDLINQLDYEGANVSKLDRLLKPEFYSYDPHIDWDKFINFEKYYWMPTGPSAVSIGNAQREITSTYNVTDTEDKRYFLFTPDGLTPAPQLTLYRGVTYKFNVDSINTLWIKTLRIDGTEAPYRVAENNGIKKGTITLTLDHTAPKVLYFVSESDKLNGGEFIIKNLDENVAIDVEKEITGKKNYTSYTGINFTNGLKVNFVGKVTPEKYQGKDFIVEGVGKAIRLVEYNSLSTPEDYTALFDETFDNAGFDEYSFDEKGEFPQVAEYITINRSSQDRNAWSRYNRWFHEDVIKLSAEANNIPVLLPFENRAKRPIIEFEPDLQLNNFGSFAKDNVQFIDTITTDVFSKVEGQLGYYVDGVELGQGDRIIFTADNDSFVNGKTYVVNFVKINDKFKISLEEAEDVTPVLGDSIIITKGTDYKGTSWWYNGSEWVYAQQKTLINQGPRFEIFDNGAISYSDKSVYNGTFSGSKVFGYTIGTGTADSILGFPLSYKDIANQGYYLFTNYFMTDVNLIIGNDTTTPIDVSAGFLKRNLSRDNISYLNVWTETSGYEIPILQYQIITEDTAEVAITAIDNPGYQQMTIDVFVNNDKKVLLDEYTLYPSGRNYSVIFKTPLVAGDKLLLKINSSATTSATGIYEPSLSWTNNPLNGPISEFTLAELNDHVKTMIDRHPEFTGSFPGTSNMRDISELGKYGTRLISNKAPLAFAAYFIANDEFNLVSATRLVGQHYNQFKLGLIDQLAKLGGKYTPIQALDIALYNMNVNKDVSFPYSLSDMIAYGTDCVTRTYPVTDSRNTTYSLTDVFNLTSLSERSVLVYHTDISGVKTQLLHGSEYYFDLYDSSVHILKPLVKGEVITVDDYSSTQGCYVPPTPTKLGMYPKFEPKIYVDDTYVDPQTVIQGHDGSIIIAFGDDRDEAILEFERRVFNNLKTAYNPELLDINSVLPGAFRTNKYTPGEVNTILSREFLKWDSFYGFNFSDNTTPNELLENPKTWNYRTGKDLVTKLPLPGNWRAVYKYFFDTDRPHTHPWEMLGFPIMPQWWEDTYGPAPYTKGNEVLWGDLEQGLIRNPSGISINQQYARPGLSKIVPVNDAGELLTPSAANIATGLDYLDIGSNWIFGDQGPVESAWRRSSHWPFAVQTLLALTNPGKYSSMLFDTSRMSKNIAGQYGYGDLVEFPSFDILKVFQDVVDDVAVKAAGYSVFLVEAGKQRNKNYVSKLIKEISKLSFKLTHKVGGFISRDKFKIVVDSVNPSSASPGVTLANEDYEIFLDKSSPVQSLGVSGVIVQRTDRGYSIRGYDTKNPFFTCLMPNFTATDPAITIGGKTESYVEWTASSANPKTGFDVTSVSTSDGYRFYRKGQVVRYLNQFYRVKLSHNSGSDFDLNNFQLLTSLPMIGGVTVKRPSRWDTVETLVPYGTEYETIEDAYATLIGYGHWLESQGAIFQEYSGELGEVLDWTFSGKEMVFWSTQKWSVGSVITLSPFAGALRFSNSKAVVDDLTNVFYEYSILKADGSTLSSKYISVVREENDFKLSTMNTTDGIYFVRLNLVQKEHTVVFENYTLFNDVIYDTETGYRQRRVKLLGFITDNWNGDIFSPGFVYDEANITTWQKYTDYSAGDVVFYAGNYYTAIARVTGTETFESVKWDILGEKPVAQLLPNFDYKIGQFEDFYSLDIDNFDQGQQKLAQHLIGYSPRSYLDNIFVNAISQYKFYQGFIKEKGTRNTISKLGKASVASQGSYIDFFEDWAFRIGSYGSFTTGQELELNLDESKFDENPQIIQFVSTVPTETSDYILYQTPNDIVIKPEGFDNNPFTLVDNLVEDGISILPTAGYVRLDDVTATAFNNDSLLDIANNRGIKDGDTVWIGFQEDGSWGVYRYTQVTPKITDAEIYVPGTSLLLTTDYYHGLNVGDIISISQFDPAIDGVYTVEAIPELNQIIVNSILVTLTIPFTPGTGLMFKFVSSRFAEFDNVSLLDTLSKFQIGEKLWIDDTGTGKWGVYERTNNFDSGLITAPTYDYTLTANQKYGETIVGNSAGTHILVGAPKFYNPFLGVYGKIYAYRKDGTGTNNLNLIGSLYPNYSAVSTYFTGTNISNYGTSIKLDSDTDYVVAGAPTASGVRYYNAGLNKFSSVSSTSTVYGAVYYTEQGFIKLSRYNFETTELIHEEVFASPQPESSAHFGEEVFVGSISTTEKLIFVSSPDQSTGPIRTGAVHYTKFTVGSGNLLTASTSSVTYGRLPVSGLTVNSKFGKSVCGTSDGKTIAVSAPGAGKIFVYRTTNWDSYTLSQTISITDTAFSYLVLDGDGFAEKITMDKTGKYLFISTPRAADSSTQIGKVFVMKLNSSNQYVLNQVISNPYTNNGYNFGAEIDIDPTGNTLVISSLGASHRPYASFDTYSKRKFAIPASDDQEYVLDPTSAKRNVDTTFDSDTVKFYSTVKNSGAVFTFVRNNDKFVFGQELYDQLVSSEQIYGSSIYVSENAVIVGGPGQTYTSAQTGAIYLFDSKLTTLNNWVKIREEEALVDLSKFKTIKTIDTEKEEVIDYLEIIDPVKGKISGLADQELKYKSLFDPAVYSIGVDGVVVDQNSNWLDEHVGELWWDLTSAKFVWYEQGSLEFRKNNWNVLFPGSMIDVYEWVKTPYLPTQWSAIADTNEGLAQGISGQPKFVSNSVVSVKQVWDSISNSFSNVYYYWVKNKVTVPEGITRKMSAYNVASLIADPKGQGLKFAAPISSDAIMLANMDSSIIGTKINLSINLDTIDNDINRHTEWILIQEGNESSLPTSRLMTKMIDSLLGRDSLGNIVPDPALPSRLKYGVEIRPRQSMFKNRTEALRVLVEYANTILAANNIVDLVDLSKFLEKDPIPNALLGQYDVVVEDLIERDFSVVTRNLKRAELSCTVSNGKITNVTIDNPGFGYGTLNLKTAISNDPSLNWIGPTVAIEGDGIGAIIETEVNIVGEIVKVSILNPGSGYKTPPTLIVRPFAVIVNVDSDVYNLWSKYEWDYTNKEYIRIHSQSYDTTKYWRYIDWIDSTYNSAQDILASIDAPYQLPALTNVPEGNYVKIRNAGDGRYIILRKITANQTAGTYNTEYDLVYQERGTIHIIDVLWNYKNSIYGWDQEAGWDQTLYSQTPDKETENIINGLMNDVFVNYLKVYKNKMFFKMVKYALTEQKFLDWAFKTSFINVINYAGALDQRPVYKLNNESYYQSYINETKPYHTKIRNFSVNYTATDVTKNIITDFDLPSVYDQTLKQFTPVTFGSTQLTQYPWKSWFENYNYSVDSIVVYDGGNGYELPPNVEIVPAVGDTTGTGAKAKAYIALGKVTQIIVTDPGAGYTATPTINLNGGGPSDLTPARVSVKMTNGKVRTNTIQMKFDRVSGYNEIQSPNATDTFTADGVNVTYNLTWAPNPDKNFITVRVNGIKELSGNFSIKVYTEKYRGYTKKRGMLVLDNTPKNASIVTIEYRKDLSLYHAVDRIRDYYNPVSGMPGNTATLLMNGLEYPGVTIDTLPFEVSNGFDTLPFGMNNWDDFIPETGLYEAKGPKVTARVADANSVNPTVLTFNISAYEDIKYVKVGATATTTSTVVTSSDYSTTTKAQWVITLNTAATGVVVGSSVAFTNPNPTTYTLPYVPTMFQNINVYAKTLNNAGSYTTVRIDSADGTTATNKNALISTFEGNGYVNTITVPRIYNSYDTVLFRLEDSDGSAPVVDIDLDTYIRGGGYYTNINGKLELTKANDLEDIIIDGEKLVSVANSYGPEENLPGRVSDSLGINVYTYPESGTGLVVTKRYIKDPYQNRYAIGFVPPNLDSVEVLLDNVLMVRGLDFDIDYNTNEIVILDSPSAGNQGPYFSTTLATPRGPIGAPIASTAGDDTSTGPYALDFEWNMFGTTFTEVYVGTNGYLTFGGGDDYYSPLRLGYLDHPAIYVEYCDLWQDYGTANNRTTPLSTGEIPGLYIETGTVGDFNFWRLRFQGGHYNERTGTPSIPAYQYEVTLYSNGRNQYIEMIYENTWTGNNFNGDAGFITGVATAKTGTVMGTGIEIDDATIAPNTSHVFYSTSNGGNWKYAGQGSFDPFKNQNLPPQVLSITTMSVGGKNPLGHEVLEINAVTGTNDFEFSPSYDTVQSSYITVNGIKRTDFTLSGTYRTKTSGRVVVTFATDLVVGDLLQVWFFASAHKGFSEVKEQVFSSTIGTRTFTLTQPPGNIAPLHSQVVVERDGVRLLPPDTIYYVAAEGQREFSLEQHYDYIDGLPDRKTVEVYVNGTRRDFSKKLRLIQDSNLIRFTSTAINDGDVIAITVLRNHDYYIDGQTLNLTDRVDVSYASKIKVITFTNHDSSLIRKERFPGTYRGMFKLTRTVLNSNYVWVEVNGRPLVREFEFTIDRDNRTVILNDSFNLSSTDTVVIMTVASQLSEQLVGYRIFRDNLGRNHYKRLSRENTTQLTADLKPLDTELTVEDSSVLTPPDSVNHRNGVILIDGERIEFSEINGNKLSGLRRGTLGTGIKTLHKESSMVVDQGTMQNIVVQEAVKKWTTSTEFWTTGTDLINYGTSTWNISALSGINFSNATSTYDQIDVFYQGRRLRKPETVFTITNTAIAYDSGEVNSLGVSSDVDQPPEFEILNGNVLKLSFLPVVNSELKVITNTSTVVGFEFADLHSRSMEQVKFLLDTPSFLPDKYYYGQNTDTDQYLTLEQGDTLDSETGDPLIGS